MDSLVVLHVVLFAASFRASRAFPLPLPGHRCPVYRLTPDGVLVGQSVKITCSFPAAGARAEEITFYHKNAALASSAIRLTDMAAVYEVQSVVLDDGGCYECRLGNSSGCPCNSTCPGFCRGRILRVAESPALNLECDLVDLDLGRLDCRWCRGQRYAYHYVRFLPSGRLEWRCRFRLHVAPGSRRRLAVVVNVTAVDFVVRAEWNVSAAFSENRRIRSAPVAALVVTSVSARAASVSWSPPESLSSRALEYLVTLVDEASNRSVASETVTSSNASAKRPTATWMHLRPLHRYKARIRCRPPHSLIFGDVAELAFTTNDSAPQEPPRVGRGYVLADNNHVVVYVGNDLDRENSGSESSIYCLWRYGERGDWTETAAHGYSCRFNLSRPQTFQFAAHFRNSAGCSPNSIVTEIVKSDRETSCVAEEPWIHVASNGSLSVGWFESVCDVRFPATWVHLVLCSGNGSDCSTSPVFRTLLNADRRQQRRRLLLADGVTVAADASGDFRPMMRLALASQREQTARLTDWACRRTQNFSDRGAVKRQLHSLLDDQRATFEQLDCPNPPVEELVLAVCGDERDEREDCVTYVLRADSGSVAHSLADWRRGRRDDGGALKMLATAPSGEQVTVIRKFNLRGKRGSAVVVALASSAVVVALLFFCAAIFLKRIKRSCSGKKKKFAIRLWTDLGNHADTAAGREDWEVDGREIESEVDSAIQGLGRATSSAESEVEFTWHFRPAGGETDKENHSVREHKENHPEGEDAESDSEGEDEENYTEGEDEENYTEGEDEENYTEREYVDYV